MLTNPGATEEGKAAGVGNWMRKGRGRSKSRRVEPFTVG